MGAYAGGGEIPTAVVRDRRFAQPGFAGLVALFLMLVRRAWWRPWVVALVVVCVTVFVLYIDPPFWIAALLELGLVGGLVWAWRIPARSRPALGKGIRP